MTSAALLLAACGGREPAQQQPPAPEAVPEGHFEASVSGVVSFRLEGKATFRLDAEGRLTGIEMDRVASLEEGISVELEALEPGEHTYQASETETLPPASAAQPPHLDAYLDIEGLSFSAVDGTLQVTDYEPDQLRGTFDLLMRGQVDEQAAEPVEVNLTGAFQATPVDVL